MRKDVKYIISDIKTGESVETPLDLSELFPGRKTTYTEYFMVFNGIEKMLADKELNGLEWRLFILLCREQMPGGWIDLTQDVMAKRLGISQPSVARALKRLKDRGYLQKIMRDSGRKCLRIAPEVAGKGNYAILQARRKYSSGHGYVAEDDPEYTP